MHIQGRSAVRSACCPSCHQPSESPHSWHQHHPQNLPCIGEAVRLHFLVKRFRCLNTDCSQKTFVEQFPDWLPAYARRATRLTSLYTRWLLRSVRKPLTAFSSIFRSSPVGGIPCCGSLVRRLCRPSDYPGS